MTQLTNKKAAADKYRSRSLTIPESIVLLAGVSDMAGQIPLPLDRMNYIIPHVPCERARDRVARCGVADRRVAEVGGVDILDANGTGASIGCRRPCRVR